MLPFILGGIIGFFLRKLFFHEPTSRARIFAISFLLGTMALFGMLAVGETPNTAGLWMAGIGVSTYSMLLPATRTRQNGQTHHNKTASRPANEAREVGLPLHSPQQEHVPQEGYFPQLLSQDEEGVDIWAGLNEDSGHGYVYILTNAVMPDILKVGCTTRSPEARAAELSRSTGVPIPYEVAYAISVADCRAVEQQFHRRFAGQRVSNSREFFRLPLIQAEKALKEIGRAYPPHLAARQPSAPLALLPEVERTHRSEVAAESVFAPNVSDLITPQTGSARSTTSTKDGSSAWGLIVIFLILCSGWIIGAFMLPPTMEVTGSNSSSSTENNSQDRPHVDPNATPTAQPRAIAPTADTLATQAARTATAEARRTSTANAARTATAQSVATASAATITVNGLAPRTNLVFGPVSETLNPESMTAIAIPYWRSDANLRNFFAEVRFHNPNRSANTEARWDYGFSFRHNNSDTYYLYVDSRGNWILQKVSNLDQSEPTFEYLDHGKVPGLDTSAHGENQLLLVAQDDKGWFFVNNQYVAILDLNSIDSTGNIIVSSGFELANAVNGRSTTFEDFSVWEILP
jgi:hypothetical protein